MSFTLGEAGNVHRPALLVLLAKGFRLSVDVDLDDDFEEWRAVKGEVTLHAGDPLRLLGLAAIHEVRGEAWQPRPDEEETLERLDDELYGDD